MRSLLTVFIILNFLILVGLPGCTPFSSEPAPGPDKQGVGMLSGAALGAGSGAITGAEVSAGAGPGALVGAGLGAVFGAFSGLGTDLIEEDQIRREEEEQRMRELAWVQEVLAEHYQRRLELHPSRDIFPADLFFCSDSSELNPQALILVHELAALTRQRMPWSRLVIASYMTAADRDSQYASFLGKKRAERIALEFVKAGVEPRRVYTRAVTIDKPVLIDPDDSPSRYRQAIEIIPLDY